MKFCLVQVWMILSCLFIAETINSQTISYKKSALLEANVQSNPPAIFISWNLDTEAEEYALFRRELGEEDWQELATGISPSQTSYADIFVQEGTIYEYQIEKKNIFGLNYDYLMSSVRSQRDFWQGKILCVIEENLYSELEAELNIYQQDMFLNAWEIEFVTVSSANTVNSIKTVIANSHNEKALRAVFLVGNIPVPYSGDISPDGIPSHKGAWPSDSYYGNMEMEWTDISVSNSSAADSRLHNIPGDGKFDQSVLTEEQAIAVGRLDYSNLGNFETEINLTKNYLNRLHLYKHEEIQPEFRCLIEDALFSYLEAPAKNVWKAASTIVGRDQIVEGDLTDLLGQESYLIAYANGICNYDACDSVVSYSDFLQNEYNSIINILYGSYFGDWDSENNLLVSAISNGTNLISLWAGRPNWILHPLALGMNLGDCLLMTQNNEGDSYEAGISAREVHIALMGDPSLSLFPRKPISNLQLIIEANNSFLSWDEYDNIALENYLVFEAIDDSLLFLASLAPDQTSFSLNCADYNEEKQYIVRAAINETTKSGSFIHSSMGASIKATNSLYDPSIEANFAYIQSGNELSLINNSTGFLDLQWFIDGELFSTSESPVLNIEEPGLVNVSLICSNPCFSDSISQEILISDLAYTKLGNKCKVWPNPNSGLLYYKSAGNGSLNITNLKGEVILSKAIGKEGVEDLSHLKKGLYFLSLSGDGFVHHQKILIL